MLAEAKNSFTRKLVAALALASLLSAAVASAGAQETAAPGGTGNEMADRMDQLIEETTGDDAGFGPVASLEEQGYSDDELGQAKLFATRVLNEHIAMRNEYMAELQSIGWASILDANRLKADAGLEQSNRMLEQARLAAVAMCEDMRPRSIANARSVAAQLKLSERQKKALVEGFILGLDRNVATTETLCRMELSILDEVAAIVSIFARDTAWEAQDGNYLFSDDRYVQEFNGRLQNVELLTKTQTDLQRKSMTQAAERMRRLDL
jgi:cell division septum initiation protein DivIVA